MTKLEEIYRVHGDAELLYSAAEVDAAVARMAGEITGILADKNPVLLCVLTGGIVAAAKLMLHLQFPLELDTVYVSRYWGALHGDELKWVHRPGEKIKGRIVLVVDDILDQGVTLAEIKQVLLNEGAAEVYSAVLVDKQLDRNKPHHADFIALTAPDRYLFGCGMDYKGYWRNAPGIYACKDV